MYPKQEFLQILAYKAYSTRQAALIHIYNLVHLKSKESSGHL